MAFGLLAFVIGCCNGWKIELDNARAKFRHFHVSSDFRTAEFRRFSSSHSYIPPCFLFKVESVMFSREGRCVVAGDVDIKRIGDLFLKYSHMLQVDEELILHFSLHSDFLSIRCFVCDSHSLCSWFV